MIDKRDIGIVIDMAASEAWKLLEEEAEREVRNLIEELRGSLDARLAGKIDGIEWVFVTLPNRIKGQFDSLTEDEKSQ